MKVAVTYENGNVFQHFGKTSQFKLYDVEGENILSEEILDTNGNGHGEAHTCGDHGCRSQG